MATIERRSSTGSTSPLHQRTKGIAHQAAVRALAIKWIRVVFRCWQNRTPYDDSVDLKALQQRGSPLIHTLGH
jgi:hypothetical protein